ncbi:hypothetical protein FB451DRAFT_428811 [Mycena latifolia]|nr:hypothetical protein FB451DRAFT_428811 [Mycena latifolia]
MDVLVTAAHRWQKADFQLKSMSVLSRIPQNPLETLEELILESKESHASVVTFLNAPCLRSVDLTIYETIIPPMPWGQLTQIAVDNPSPQACLDALVQCANIVSARFHTLPWPTLPNLSAPRTTTLARLERLSFSIRVSNPGEHFISFFTCLALPALKDLHLRLDDVLTWTSAEFIQFQRRSPKIETLSISSANISSSDLLTVLRHAPLLTTLSMVCCEGCLDDSLIAALEYSERDAVPLAPMLQGLSFSEAGDNFEEDALYSMIESRMWTDDQDLAFPTPPRVARWSKIEICRGDGCDFTPEVEAKLDGYRSQGLDIELC